MNPNISFDEINDEIYTTTSPSPQNYDSDEDLYISSSKKKEEYILYIREECEPREVSNLLINILFIKYTNYIIIG